LSKQGREGRRIFGNPHPELHRKWQVDRRPDSESINRPLQREKKENGELMREKKEDGKKRGSL
jgi:hypothetical protein